MSKNNKKKKSNILLPIIIGIIVVIIIGIIIIGIIANWIFKLLSPTTWCPEDMYWNVDTCDYKNSEGDVCPPVRNSCEKNLECRAEDDTVDTWNKTYRCFKKRTNLTVSPTDITAYPSD